MARLTLLAKSADISNLFDWDHREHSILSSPFNPPAIVTAFEQDTPSLEEPIRSMEACSHAGYTVRAVVMPIIPLPDWESAYRGLQISD
jgi:spore photoproduct lyase